MKNLLIFLLLCLLSSIALAQSPSAPAASPYFELNVEDADFPLTATRAEVNIAGVIADVTVTQTYVNNGSERLEATYVFPGSTGSAVYGMTMVIGNRRIVGDIQRKAEARETYEQAKAEGKRASLLEQHRPNVFQMNVANILPGDTVEVELKYTEVLVPTGGTYSFVYPTVVGPRYVNGTESQNDGYTAQPYTKSEPTYDFDLSIYLNAGVPVSRIASPSHKVVTTRYEEAINVSLAGSESKGGNRDFVLQYNLQGDAIQTGMLTFEGPDGNYFLYMAQPPAETTDGDYPPREFIFVVDVSGSMMGFPLEVSKELLTNLIGSLRPVDEFNILLFAGRGATWKQSSVPATKANLESAKNFLSHAQGGGGTELLNALNIAYNLPRSYTGLSRNIIIATDGYIGVEPEAFDLIRSRLNEANVYSFGIGSGVNRHLIDGMARVGRGRPAYVLDPSEAKEESARFQEYISKPVLTEVTLDFGDKFDAYDVEPISIPDVSTERPLVVFGKFRGKARGKLTLTGYGGYVGLNGKSALLSSTYPRESDYRKRSYEFNLREAKQSDRHAALAQLWARERIRRLDDYNNLYHNEERVEEVTQLGLAYNLLTQYTSFVAVEELIAVDPDSPLKTVKQPLPLPQNVAATAVGFDLGVLGIAGLPKGQKPHWGWYGLLGLTLIVAVWRLFWGRSWPNFGGLGSFRDLLPLLLLAVMVGGLTSCTEPAVTTEIDAPDYLTLDPRARQITFILGSDEGTNAYYARAAEYFRQHPDEGGERVIQGMTSLQEVRDMLARTPVQGGWETVNLVVHGNQWTGLACKPRNGDQQSRVTANLLAEWEPRTDLEASTITESTEIIVHGCSVGKDQALLAQLSRVFGEAGGPYPTVSASEDFTLFREGIYGMERYYADYVFRARPLGKYPLPEVMANRLRRQHPEKKVDWDAALANSRFSEELAPHLYQFNVPVTWTRVYPKAESVAQPDGANPERKWLENEDRLVATLREMGLAPKDFSWEFSAGVYDLPDGERIPAVTAQGVSRLFCVLLPRPEGESTFVSLRYGV